MKNIWFDIFFFVGLLLYVAGGVAFNVKVNGRKPTLEEAFPQWEYWIQLPGLVQDGCAFTWEVAQKAYYNARHQAAPLDPSLSRRLADDVDGGANAT